MKIAFSARTEIQDLAHKGAREINYTLEVFSITLDWSDDSMVKVESVLDQRHAAVAIQHPTEQQIRHFGFVFGSYIGETFRRNHGANWGLITMDSDSFPGISLTNSGKLSWPFQRVENRIRNGNEDDIWWHYQVLLAEDQRSPMIRHQKFEELSDYRLR